MRFSTLDQWLSWQETLHPSEIELGLDRVSQVLESLELTQPDFFVVTVAGTNGKGSSVAMLQSILLAAGCHVGAYTSPHLLNYNERIQINGQHVDDQALCESFERIDQARGDIKLTYFEFGTLAAIDILQRAGVDVAVLEVGLGGRLDAVNVLDADVALITAIDIDHENWLGSDRESIAREKAGILRPSQPAIFSGTEPPRSLIETANDVKAHLFILGRDFRAQIDDRSWSWWGVESQRLNLSFPALQGLSQFNNAAGVLAVLEQLQKKMPVLSSIKEEEISRALENVSLPGRFQVLPGKPVQILDVAHNPQSARVLADNLDRVSCAGKTRAVLAMLGDKDIPSVINCLREKVDEWYVASLDVPRGATAQQISDELYKQKIQEQEVQQFESPELAQQAALEASEDQDRIVVFGSFYTVAAALPQTV